MYLTLTSGLSYMYKDTVSGHIVHFQKSRAKLVTEDLGSRLLMTGKFRVVEPQVIQDGPTVDMVVKFTGSIGDAVVTANCLAGIHKTFPDKTIRVSCNSRYVRMVHCIAPGVNATGVTVHQMTKNFIDLASAKRTHGEGFAWEAGIASALGLSEYPHPQPIKLLSKPGHRYLQEIKKNRTRPLLAGIHLWSGHSRSKSYDPMKVPVLIKKLQNKGYDCVIFGGRGDPHYSVDAIDVRGFGPLMGSFAALNEVDVGIAIDSWVWHAAKLLFKPQVVLFGSLRCEGKPRTWENVEVLRGTLCEGKNCNVYTCPLGKSNCIDSIEISAILDRVETVMARAKEAKAKTG